MRNTIPLSKKICDSIVPKLYEYLIVVFPNICVLDVYAFIQENNYEPCISTIFYIAHSGSFTYTDKYNRYVAVKNGTLSQYDDGNNWHVISAKYRQILDAQHAVKEENKIWEILDTVS